MAQFDPATTGPAWGGRRGFKVKRVKTKLFGVVEDPNQEGWLNKFDTGVGTSSVAFGQRALNLLSEELQFEADGPM